MEMHKDAIVKVDRITGLLALFLNIFIAGSGTIVAGAMAGRGDTRTIMNNVIVGGL